jgi:rhodanese-related sulfurtransferase
MEAVPMSDKQVKELTPEQAHQILQENPRALLIDVRSTMEYLFVGHPAGAIHIAWIDEPDWKINPHFVTDVRKVLLGGVACHGDGCAPVILVCRSGKRSLEAGKVLVKDGIKDVYHINEGFEGELDEHHHRGTRGGWRFRGLPWEQC